MRKQAERVAYTKNVEAFTKLVTRDLGPDVPLSSTSFTWQGLGQEVGGDIAYLVRELEGGTAWWLPCKGVWNIDDLLSELAKAGHDVVAVGTVGLAVTIRTAWIPATSGLKGAPLVSVMLAPSVRMLVAGAEPAVLRSMLDDQCDELAVNEVKESKAGLHAVLRHRREPHFKNNSAASATDIGNYVHAFNAWFRSNPVVVRAFVHRPSVSATGYRADLIDGALLEGVLSDGT